MWVLHRTAIHEKLGLYESENFSLRRVKRVEVNCLEKAENNEYRKATRLFNKAFLPPMGKFHLQSDRRRKSFVNGIVSGTWGIAEGFCNFFNYEFLCKFWKLEITNF